MARIKPENMDWWTWRNGSQCKPTKNQKEIDACPSNVCSCYAYGVREEEEAKTSNAKLIASAPDLLDAVSDAVRDLGDITRHYHCKGSMEQCEALLASLKTTLAKAKGDAQCLVPHLKKPLTATPTPQ